MKDTKKALIIWGVALLIAAVVLGILGTVSRILFYGIMDAPYSVYGKYGVFMKIFYVAAIIAVVAGIGCLIAGIVRRK